MGWGRETINNHFTGDVKIPTVIDIDTGNAISSTSGLNRDTDERRQNTSDRKIGIVDNFPNCIMKNDLISIIQDKDIVNKSLINDWNNLDTNDVIPLSFLNYLPLDTLYKIKHFLCK